PDGDAEFRAPPLLAVPEPRFPTHPVDVRRAHRHSRSMGPTWRNARVKTIAAATATLLAVLVAAPAAAQNRLTRAERSEGWRLLFDGKTLAGWRGLGYDSVPTAHWKV